MFSSFCLGPAEIYSYLLLFAREFGSHSYFVIHRIRSQTVNNFQVNLKPLTVFRRISSKIRLLRFVSAMTSAWSTDTQINISNFNMFFMNRSALAMATNNNTNPSDIYLFKHRSLIDELHGEEKHERKKLKRFRVWGLSLSNSSFFLRHRFLNGVDAWTDLMVMIAFQSYTFSYKNIFRVSANICARPTPTKTPRASEKGGKTVRDVACAGFLGEGLLCRRLSRSSEGPIVPRAKKVSCADETKIAILKKFKIQDEWESSVLGYFSASDTKMRVEFKETCFIDLA